MTCFKEIVATRFSDTDALGHINNTMLPIWFEGARDPIFKFFMPDLDLSKWSLILAKIEVSFEKINSNKLPGGRWRIASGINEANVKRIEESIITIGLDDGIDDPIFRHKRNSIFAIFEE